MALITSSIEMSFSLSRLRRALRSMSTRLPRIVAAEFHLNSSWPEFGEAELALLTLDIENDAVLSRRGDPAVHHPLRHRNDDQPAHGAPPVPRLGERAVHARRADLKRVRGLAHDPRGIKFRRKFVADQRDVVEADPATRICRGCRVDYDTQHAAPARPGDVDRVKVHAGRARHRLGQPLKLGSYGLPAARRRLLARRALTHRYPTGASVHHDLLAQPPAGLLSCLNPA